MDVKYKIAGKDLPGGDTSEGRYDVLIMIPTANEYEGILDELRSVLSMQNFQETPRVREVITGIRIFRRVLQDNSEFRVAMYTEGLQGNTATAAHTAYLCYMLMPRTIISAGIAGSFDPKNAWIGDIVLPAKVENSYFDKVYAQDTTPLPQMGAELHASRKKYGAFTSAMRLSKKNEEKIRGATAVIGGLTKSALENAIAYAPHDDKQNERTSQFSALEEHLKSKYEIVAKAPNQPRVITKNARTFSWDKVFDSRELYEFLLENDGISDDALCVEMESWGFLAATNLSRLHRDCEVLIVRAISDIVGCKGVTDDKVHDLEGECRKLAMSNVAKIVGQIIADKCR